MKDGTLEAVGFFTVDSGIVMIGDPCYLDEWEPDDDSPLGDDDEAAPPPCDCVEGKSTGVWESTRPPEP